MAKNTQHALRLPAHREALIARAIAADDAAVSVGGLAAALGMLPAPAERGTPAPRGFAPAPLGLQALARLVEFSRRRAGLSPEQFAAESELDLRELLDLEAAQEPPEPRVLYQVSQRLRVRYENLLALAGHRRRRNAVLERETLRFAAHSGPMSQLTKAEAEALQDFLRVLNEEGPQGADEQVPDPEDR